MESLIKTLMYAAGGFVGLIILVIVLPRLLRRRSGGVSVLGLSGEGQVSGHNLELKITYFFRVFKIFKRMTGTITYAIIGTDLHVGYQVKQETGERKVALDSIYATSLVRQNKKMLFLVLCIITALLSIIGAIMETVALLGLLLAVIFFLLWFFQRRAISFSMLFGGTGDIGSSVRVVGTDADMIIGDFLSQVYAAAQICRDENGSRPVQKLLRDRQVTVKQQVFEEPVKPSFFEKSEENPE